MELDSLLRPRSRLSLGISDENRPPLYSIASQRQTVQEKAVLSDLYRARNPARDSASTHGRHSPAAASLRKSLEISKLRPTTNLPASVELPSRKTCRPENDSPVSRKRQKSINIGRRVLSRVKDGVLRVKSISKLPSDSELGHLARCGANVATPDPAAFQSEDIDHISREWNPRAPEFLSLMPQKVPPGDEELPQAWLPVPHLELRQSFDATRSGFQHQSDFRTTVRIAAVTSDLLARSCVTSDAESGPPSAVHNLLVKVKACDGFEAIQVEGPVYQARLALGEDLDISVQCISSPGKSRDPAASEEFEDLCSEIESLLRSTGRKGNAFALKVTYSIPSLPSHVRFVHRQEFGLPTGDRSTTSTPPCNITGCNPDFVETQTNPESPMPAAGQDGDGARIIWQEIRRLSRCEPDLRPPTVDRWNSIPMLEPGLTYHPLRDLAVANKRSVDEATLLELDDLSTAGSAPWL